MSKYFPDYISDKLQIVYILLLVQKYNLTTEAPYGILCTTNSETLAQNNMGF
jgi:hypothetical protein